jgi:hypothetical protein
MTILPSLRFHLTDLVGREADVSETFGNVRIPNAVAGPKPAAGILDGRGERLRAPLFQGVAALRPPAVWILAFLCIYAHVY